MGGGWIGFKPADFGVASRREHEEQLEDSHEAGPASASAGVSVPKGGNHACVRDGPFCVTNRR